MIEMVNRTQVFEAVRDVIVDSLGCMRDEVELTARLTDDLGAESIDFLDITFRLEARFKIRIQRDEWFLDAVQPFDECVQNSKITPKGIAEIKRRLPHVDLTAFEQNPDVALFGAVYTVQCVVDYVCGKVGLP